jgi:hypothetical protein
MMINVRQVLFVGGALLKGVVELWALHRARRQDGMAVRRVLRYSRN